VISGFHAHVDRRALGRGLEAIVAVRIRPHSRQYVDAFWREALELPEVVQVFHVTGADDFLLHAAVADTEGLRDFVLDRLTVRAEVAHVESRVVYDQARRPALEPLYD
jgi:DNA-binding Lrp family transcriptional regulator